MAKSPDERRRKNARRKKEERQRYERGERFESTWLKPGERLLKVPEALIDAMVRAQAITEADAGDDRAVLAAIARAMVDFVSRATQSKN